MKDLLPSLGAGQYGPLAGPSAGGAGGAGAAASSRFRTALGEASSQLQQAAQSGPDVQGGAVAGLASAPASASAFHRIERGETLTSIARKALTRQAEASGAPVSISGAALHRAALELARANGITNPNLIYAGDTLDISVLTRGAGVGGAESAAGGGAGAVLPAAAARLSVGLPAASPGAATAGAPAAVAITSRPAGSVDGSPAGSSRAGYPVLDRTLDRAVSRGYIPADERGAVRDRIVEMGDRYRFSPDDFAMMTLMESDGMDPRASNGRCHGIIQFCEGADRGAASVGFQGRAEQIRDQSVLQQLDLVERYFKDVGLDGRSQSNLMDLYLSVLTPSARSERRPHADLGIAGPQAAMLHVGGDQRRPITRHSLEQGLLRNTFARLGISPSDTSNGKLVGPDRISAAGSSPDRVSAERLAFLSRHP